MTQHMSWNYSTLDIKYTYQIEEKIVHFLLFCPLISATSLSLLKYYQQEKPWLKGQPWSNFSRPDFMGGCYFITGEQRGPLIREQDNASTMEPKSVWNLILNFIYSKFYQLFLFYLIHKMVEISREINLNAT